MSHPDTDRESAATRPGRLTARLARVGFADPVRAAELLTSPALRLWDADRNEVTDDAAAAVLSALGRAAVPDQALAMLAELAKAAGVTRFVYMSSCSVYGVADADFVTEQSSVNPQTAYAICKTLVERDLKPMADDNFSPTFLRNATAYGASPRMRFDIVLNNLAGLAWTTREIKMISDGTPWRPLVHGLDIAKAILCTLAAPREAVHNETFNVGDTTHNYTVREIAEIVGQVFPGCQVSFGQQGADNRSYRVSFDKIKGILPGFSCDWNAQRGAEQLRAVFTQIAMTPETFSAPGFTRLKQLEHLIRTHQIDQDFFWKQNGTSLPL